MEKTRAAPTHRMVAATMWLESSRRLPADVDQLDRKQHDDKDMEANPVAHGGGGHISVMLQGRCGMEVILFAASRPTATG